MTEDFVLIQNLLHDLPGATNEVGTVQRTGRFELCLAHRRPAPLATDLVHDERKRGERLVDRALPFVGYEAVGVDAEAESRAIVSGALRRPIVEIDQGGELFRLPADNGQGERQAKPAGTNDRFGRSPDGDPDWK